MGRKTLAKGVLRLCGNSFGPRWAAKALGTIRLVNGFAALFAPYTLQRRVGIDPESNRAAVYGLRMFGIRTVVIGAELLLGHDEERLRRALDQGVLIHASDTACAAYAGWRGNLSRRSAVMATAISGFNTGLALYARSGRR